MQKVLTPGVNIEDTIRDNHFDFHANYFVTDYAYAITDAEVNLYENATNELHAMCMDLVNTITDEELRRLHIPEQYHQLIRNTRHIPSIYGRFDLSLTGQLLEYNSDTPTTLYEASIAQWDWLQAYDDSLDQFNSIDEQLSETILAQKPFHFLCMTNSQEDFITTSYLAMFSPDSVVADIRDVKWDDNKFRVHGETPNNIFKLYPWEWMMNEEYGANLLISPQKWYNPIWNSILSNKMLLVLLWERHAGHPNLLETSETPLSGRYVKKHLFSREGQNITFYDDTNVIGGTDGIYDNSPAIYQRMNIPNPIIGSWVINNQSAGIGIRETRDASCLITRDDSLFVPHFII